MRALCESIPAMHQADLFKMPASTGEILADSPPQRFPDLSLFCVHCAGCLSPYSSGMEMQRYQGENCSLWSPKNKGITQRGGQHNKSFGPGAKTSGLCVSFFFFVCSESEICPSAASGFVFLHLQSRAVTA